MRTNTKHNHAWSVRGVLFRFCSLACKLKTICSLQLLKRNRFHRFTLRIWKYLNKKLTHRILICKSWNIFLMVYVIFFQLFTRKAYTKALPDFVYILIFYHMGYIIKFGCCHPKAWHESFPCTVFEFGWTDWLVWL